MGKFQVVRGAEKRPHAFILTGRSGIGKTYLASTIPARFFLCVEQGLKGAAPDQIEDLPRFERPESLGEALEMLAEFRSMARAEGHRHLVVDSLSGLERLVNLHVCRSESVAHMEAKDFAKLWTAAMPHWQRVQAELDRVRDEAKAHVWVIAHGQEVREATQDGETFQKWDLAMQGSGKSVGELRTMWRAWADHVLFLDWDATVKKGASIGQKSVGKYSARVLRCRETPQHYAKSRASVPAMLPATWADLEKALRAGAPAPDAKLRADVAALLPSLGDADRAAIEKDLGAAKGAAAVAAVLSRAQGMLAVSDEERTVPDGAPASPGAPSPLVARIASLIESAGTQADLGEVPALGRELGPPLWDTNDPACELASRWRARYAALGTGGAS